MCDCIQHVGIDLYADESRTEALEYMIESPADAILARLLQQCLALFDQGGCHYFPSLDTYYSIMRG